MSKVQNRISNYYLGPCQTSVWRSFSCKNSEQLALNYFYKKNSIIDVWQGPKFKIQTDRNSWSQMFFKICVLKNFAIFTGKHLCSSFFSIKLLAFNTGVFLWILRNFQEQLFYRAPAAASQKIAYPNRTVIYYEIGLTNRAVIYVSIIWLNNTTEFLVTKLSVSCFCIMYLTLMLIVA